MPRIRCHYEDCIFLEEKYCGAAAVEIDPDAGCQTYSQVDDTEVAEAAEWDEDLLEEEEEELYEEEEEDDDWDEEEAEDYR